jgi:HAMP domain-containing protein
MNQTITDILRRAENWPQEDQDELAELAREIEARRSGVYRPTAEELRALDEAERSGVATDEEVEAAFQSFRRK